MKKNIHPEFQESVFSCACGNEIRTRSLKEEYKLEICAGCHPFFTGKQKLVDSAGRVERFMKKYGDNPISTGKKPAKVPKKAAKQVKEVKAKKPASKTDKPS
ncbi:MAG: large subunit ribosomal protein [Thermodesulfobacteriota bacterium]|nr:large subunit ribosomal protein [Thermodesulfobacteriota bacterium]